MSYQYKPCEKCGHVNQSPKKGQPQDRRKLAEEICDILGWEDEAFVLCNRPLSRPKMLDLLEELRRKP